MLGRPEKENLEDIEARHRREIAAYERDQRLEKGNPNADDLKWALEQERQKSAQKEREWQAKFKELELKLAKERSRTSYSSRE